MKDDILGKLRKILSEPIENEYQVVYIIVEIRKLLENINKDQYNLLRFYCHWALHNELNNLSPVREILNKIFEEHQKGDFGDTAFKFISFEHLKNEMILFCKEDNINLPIKFLENHEQWRIFRRLFAGIIKDSPLKIKPEQKPIFIEKFSLKKCEETINGKSREFNTAWEYKLVDNENIFYASINEIEKNPIK